MRFARTYVLAFFSLLLAFPVFAQQPSTSTTQSSPEALALLQESLAALTGGQPITDVTLTRQAAATTDQQLGTLPSQRDPQAVAILQASYLALGGATQLLPTRLSAVGTHTVFSGASSASYPIRLMALGADKIRWETDLPGGTVTSIIRGHGGWIQDTDGTTVLSVADTVGQAVENLPLLALANWANSPNTLVSFVSTESLDGAIVYHISLTDSRDPNASPDSDSEKILRNVKRCDLYVNQQTNLLARLRYSEHPGDWRRSIPVDLVFSDYRSVSGLLFPFVLTRYRSGQMSSQTQLQSVVLNPPVKDDLFWVNQP